MQQIKRLIIEAHRRSLWQVLGIYAVASGTAYQAILALTDGIGLPYWVPGMAVVLILIGLPVVLATAFVQEGLPARSESRPGLTSSPMLDPTLFPYDDATQRPTTSGTAPSPRKPRGALGRTLTWRRALLAGAFAFVLLGAGTTAWVGLRSLGIGPMGSLVAAGRLAPSDRILIADFETRGGADTTLAAVVTEAFRIDFARSTLVRAADPAQLREVLVRMQRPDVTRLDGELAREVALRAGISAFVTGEVTAAAGAHVVTARLIEAESGEVLAAFRERARDDEDVINAIDRLSRAVRERTGESLKAVRRSRPLEKVTTPSLEALQKYTQAIRATGWEGDPARGFRLLQEAVALDSAFAAAHRALAIEHWNRNQPELALASIERALRSEQRLGDLERELTYGSYHSIRGEYAQAAAAYERVLKLNPRHFAALNNLALEYEELYDYTRAEAYLRRAIEADTARFFGYTNLGELLVFVGRFDEARQAFDAGITRAPESGWPTVNRAVLPIAEGKYAEAESELLRLIDRTTSNQVIRDGAERRLLHVLLLRGRLAAAENRVESQARANGGPAAVERQLAGHRVFVSLRILRNADRARELVRQGRTLLTGNEDSGTFLQLAAACGFTGDVACARDALKRAGHQGAPQPWSNMQVYVALGAIALADGQFDQAIRHFRGVRDRRCPRCEESLVGSTFERMQQPDSAIAAYERYLSIPSLERVFSDAYDLAFVLERLGALYDQRNDRAKAAHYYARLVALWKDADPELQPRVAAANQRLRLLQLDR